MAVLGAVQPKLDGKTLAETASLHRDDLPGTARSFTFAELMDSVIAAKLESEINQFSLAYYVIYVNSCANETFFRAGFFLRLRDFSDQRARSNGQRLDG